MLTNFGCASDNPAILYDRPRTVPYFALEQGEGETHGQAVDYWSCGIIGLELILKRVISSGILPVRDLEYLQPFLNSSDSPLIFSSYAGVRSSITNDICSSLTIVQAILGK